ncbi:HAD family hydrolase [Roseovarius aestuariivivens]|uniref:HAD family hydrolase n=1 Tax=Roseovarius aestuariivivens TaxID=1888910 RepID=UPI0010810D2E|nr:HAD family hydrolase [Roseovarius aestuariivivens]
MVNGAERKIDGLIFDKDGTLFDFHTTWSTWAHGVIADLTGGDPDHAARMAAEMDYDLAARRFRPSSPLIAGTNREAAECVARALPGRDVDEVEAFLMRATLDVPQAEAVPLAPFLGGIRRAVRALGVVTNDTEAGARAHLGRAGVLDSFDFVAGFDSGHGAKPDPGPLLAFARVTGLDPACIAMVGDSTHDLIAGRAAGMRTIGVLTGPAEAAALAPHADIVLPDIGHIPDWLRA